MKDATELRLVHPAKLPPNVEPSIRFSATLAGETLVASYKVRGAVPEHVNESLPKDDSAWGLWDWDVVELFLCCTPGGPVADGYYEMQVSPLDQWLELRVFEPRKRVDKEFRSGFRHRVRKLGLGAWDAELDIPLKALGWDGRPASIVGNAFAILGPPEKRTYWSLFLGPQQTPDFHLPAEFRGLL